MNKATEIQNRIARLRTMQQDLRGMEAALSMEIKALQVEHDRAVRTMLDNVAERETSLVAAADRAANYSLVHKVAEFYGIDAALILGRSREQRIVKARHSAMWTLRTRGLSFKAIGRIFDRDHTTVMNAVEKVDHDHAWRSLLWPLLKE